MNCREIPRSTWFGHLYGITIRDGTRTGELRRPIECHHRAEGNRNANVQISAGAIILGPIHIGDNATIGAGSVALTDVPSNTMYISKHGAIVKSNDPSCKTRHQDIPED